MEKIKLNNQVVLMRKYVKQAKVHIINKLVKQAKLLQNRKGNEVQIQKAKRKAERFIEEVAVLKKIKPDGISKLALSKAKDWKDVLQQKNSSLHDRCIAMLANYEAVQKEVEVFYSANKGLVSKITDLIKLWEEKNKYAKDSPKIKNMSNKKKIDKMVKNANLGEENMLSDARNKLDVVETNNKLSSNDGNLKKSVSFNQKDELKKNENKATNKQNKMPAVEVQENMVSNKLSRQEWSNDDHVENALEVEQSNDDLAKSATESDMSDSDNDTRNKFIEIKRLNDNENLAEDRIKTKNLNSDENEENSMEIEESDSDNDEESVDDITENTEETKNPRNEDGGANEPQKLEELKHLNTDNCTKKKLKTVSFLNLDELEGLDEIPISSASENDESDEERTGEDETNDDSKNEISDPFFLRCADKDTAEDKLVDSSKDNDFTSRDTMAIFYNKSTVNKEEKNVQRRENLNNQFSPKKHFQKFPNSSKGDPTRFKKDRDNFKPFRKDKFTSRNYDKFKERSKGTFDRNRSKYQKDFKMKHETYVPKETHWKKKQEHNSANLSYKSDGKSFLPKDKVPPKKGCWEPCRHFLCHSAS